MLFCRLESKQEIQLQELETQAKCVDKYGTPATPPAHRCPTVHKCDHTGENLSGVGVGREVPLARSFSSILQSNFLIKLNIPN